MEEFKAARPPARVMHSVLSSVGVVSGVQLEQQTSSPSRRRRAEATKRVVAVEDKEDHVDGMVDGEDDGEGNDDDLQAKEVVFWGNMTEEEIAKRYEVCLQEEETASDVLRRNIEAREQAEALLRDRLRAQEEELQRQREEEARAAELARQAAAEEERERLEAERQRVAALREEAERLLKESEEKLRAEAAELERLRKQAESEERECRRQERIQQIGICPQRFRWRKISGGYRCEGGSHYLSDRDIGP